MIHIHAAALKGLEAVPVTIEMVMDTGIGYHLVGLPDNAVREGHHRIAAALGSLGYRIPGKRLTVNMAPADVRKEGGAFDLPLALGILAVSGRIPFDRMDGLTIMGELALDGGIRPIRGALSVGLMARDRGARGVILPAVNAEEAAMVEGLPVHPAHDLGSLIDNLCAQDPLPRAVDKGQMEFLGRETVRDDDLSEVVGQGVAKRCLEIAAAGGHDVVMVGPPGSGKTMLARRLPGLLPPMSREEALETTRVHSVRGIGTPGPVRVRPFRDPHHSLTRTALLGGGRIPMPGEVSLAHNGVLFLDEMGEFARSTLEGLRQPLEERVVRLSRMDGTVAYPSDFQLVGGMNPVERDRTSRPPRVSGPIWDRIDIQTRVEAVPVEALVRREIGESSATVRARVERARALQARRFEKKKGYPLQCPHPQRRDVDLVFPGRNGSRARRRLAERMGLSARGFDRLLKVARTIADLDGDEAIMARHLERRRNIVSFPVQSADDLYAGP